MVNIFEARDAAFKLVEEKTEYNEKPLYNLYSPIYIASTSNVISTVGLYSNYDSVLSVGSTGAHGFETALNGAKKIDLFDVNYLQKLYFEYMKTAIIYLDYQEFVKYFTLKGKNDIIYERVVKDLLSEELYSKIYSHLPKEVEKVFTPLYDYFGNTTFLISNLFRYGHKLDLDYLKRNVSFYNEEQYYKLQQILRNDTCQISYNIVNLTELDKFYKSKYDLILLDNILQYFKNIPTLNKANLVDKFIRERLSSLLNENGSIQVSYGYEVATVCLKKEFDIPSGWYEEYSLINELILEREKDNMINNKLLKEYSGYKYDFFPGVERYHGGNSENMVLTYKKNNK